MKDKRAWGRVGERTGEARSLILEMGRKTTEAMMGIARKERAPGKHKMHNPYLTEQGKIDEKVRLGRLWIG